MYFIPRQVSQGKPGSRLASKAKNYFPRGEGISRGSPDRGEISKREAGSRWDLSGRRVIGPSRLPGTRNAGYSPEFHGFPRCSGFGAGIYRRFQQSAPRRPWDRLGSGRLLLKTTAGRREVQSGGRPHPLWDAAHWPSIRNLAGAQTERLSKHKISIKGRKTRGPGDFFKEAGPEARRGLYFRYAANKKAPDPQVIKLCPQALACENNWKK
jgi:hypothetical protein